MYFTVFFTTSLHNMTWPFYYHIRSCIFLEKYQRRDCKHIDGFNTLAASTEAFKVPEYCAFLFFRAGGLLSRGTQEVKRSESAFLRRRFQSGTETGTYRMPSPCHYHGHLWLDRLHFGLLHENCVQSPLRWLLPPHICNRWHPVFSTWTAPRRAALIIVIIITIIIIRHMESLVWLWGSPASTLCIYKSGESLVVSAKGWCFQPRGGVLYPLRRSDTCAQSTQI